MTLASSMGSPAIISGPATAQEFGPFSAVVAPTEARFTFPIPKKEIWKWNREGTRVDAREFQWEIMVKNAGVTYAFGYSIYKYQHSKPTEGSFRELIAHGQETLWKVKENGSASAIREAGIWVRPEEDDRLVIWVLDKSTRDELFSTRPDSVTFRWMTPESGAQSRTVRITYTDS